ncbi:hypothetical protein FYK55_08325 [Roseiconus nitratireducens]|uniref:Uncharacterized protein n=1 Tax=Roseiconus nitratireducens TaxID=2605748 RepID=A0A5M6DD02_9BACT|nr:hypothetical protein [Roseiconus nitratireducens]KAA5544346.1 hypothetical protein FYK55_08325 [Roseiconus nitratireducens]
MLSRRLTLCCLTFAITCLTSRTADAGCGCLDWLFGKSTTPYVAGYPYAPNTYAAAYPAVAQPVSQPYVSGYAPTACPTVAPTTYSAGYPGSVTTAYPGAAYPAATYPTAAAAAPPLTGASVATPNWNSGAVAVQRPSVSYGANGIPTYDNPSVYTGLPVTTTPTTPAELAPNQSSYRLPLSGTPYPSSYPSSYSSGYSSGYSSTVSPTASYGTSYGQLASPASVSAARVPIESTLRGNAGLNPITPSYSSYSANYSGVAPTSYAAPVTTAPVQTLPLATQPTFGSGLSRFFNSLLGRNETNYVSSYYRAPITYYRPLSSVDPVTGTTVTVQQPCTSYTQQLQRVPYNTFLPLGSTAVPSAAQPSALPPGMPVQSVPGSCNSPGSVTPMSGIPGSSTPGSFAPPPPSFPSQSTTVPGGNASGIGQMGAEISPGDRSVVPIPSIAPEDANPNLAPLSGDDASSPSDRDPMPKPQLQSQRPPSNGSGPVVRQESTLQRSSPAQPPSGQDRDDEETASQDDPDSPIRLEPPVNDQSGNPIRNELFRREQSLTANNRSAGNTSADSTSAVDAPALPPRQFSSLRPIGAPDDFTPPFTGEKTFTGEQTTPTSNSAPELKSSRPTLDLPEPPALPAPTDTNRYQDSASGISIRGRSPAAVTVPIREATTRSETIRQVGAWDEVSPSRTVAPRPTPSQPAPSSALPRDRGGWLPVR